jgi:hypothetical protein
LIFAEPSSSGWINEEERKIAIGFYSEIPGDFFCFFSVLIIPQIAASLFHFALVFFYASGRKRTLAEGVDEKDLEAVLEG